MDIFKIIITYIFIVAGLQNSLLASPQPAEKSTPMPVASLEEEQSYKLVLPNGLSMQFARQLIDQSELLKAALKNDTEFPITQYIKSVGDTTPDDVSLHDLHMILTVITENQQQVEQALEKLLFAKQPSWPRILRLFEVAMYFDIKPLEELIGNRLAVQFMKDAQNPAYKKDLLDLPAPWLSAVMPFIASQSKLLQDYFLYRTLPGDAPVKSIAWSRNGQLIASGHLSTLIKVRNVKSGALVGQFVDRLALGEGALTYGPARSIAWSSDGAVIASSGLPGSDSFTVWDVKTGNVINDQQRLLAPILSVAWSADSKFMASGSEDKTISLWPRPRFTHTRILQGHKGAVRSVCWAPDSKSIASGSDDNGIKIWSPTTGHILRNLEGHQGPVYSVAFSPDGRFLASGSADRTIKIWSVETGALINTFRGHNDIVSSITWSPDGKQLASGSWDKTIKIWELGPKASMPRTWKGHDRMIYSVAWSPTNQFLASSSDDGTVKIWRTDPQLFKISMAQLELLENSIKSKKIDKNTVEAKHTYDTLPPVWQKLLGDFK